MKTACFIPIKLHSERVPGKNFRILNGKKLYMHIIENIIKANCFDDVYVDTNSDEVKEYAHNMNIGIIDRVEKLADNSANGNDLLYYDYQIFPDYDYYFQLFVTSPFLQPESILDCFNALVSSNKYDSCFTANAHNGFFWLNGIPMNYRPDVLPRSQDLIPVIEETTGLYGITKEALEKYRCRIGKTPYIHIISKFESVDINTEEDLVIADFIGKHYWKID